jgi:hypothetical protein
MVGLVAAWTPASAAMEPTKTDRISSPSRALDKTSGPADTLTALSVDPISGSACQDVTLEAAVSRPSNVVPAGSGTVEFFDSALLISSKPLTDEGATLTAQFAPGRHQFTVRFVPNDPTQLNPSTSFEVDAAYDQVDCSQTDVDPQTAVVRVPTGGLIISTPYTPANPFSLGTMELNSDGVTLSASADFPAAGDHLVITDTRAGDLPWTATVTSTDLTSPGGGVIDTDGLALTDVAPTYLPDNALNPDTNPVFTGDVDSVKGGPHRFAIAEHGAGTVFIQGRLTLVAPSSAVAGTYCGTLTFTLS